MGKSLTNLVDEGFRVSLVETAFFDGKFEIPHVVAPSKIIIPKGMVPFSARERSQDKKDFVCFYEHDINFREILTNTEEYVEDLKRFPGFFVVLWSHVQKNATAICFTIHNPLENCYDRSSKNEVSQDDNNK